MYKSMGSMGNASSLSGTSIQLHEMFKKNIPSICNGVLPHAVTGCSQARDFFHAQQEIATMSLPILNDPTQATIKRIVEFLLMQREHLVSMRRKFSLTTGTIRSNAHNSSKQSIEL